MKILMKKSFTQKIIVAIIFVILFNFSVPVEAKAFSWGDLGSKLLKELINLVITLGDIVMGLLNKVMLGASDMNSAILVYDEAILPSINGGGTGEGVTVKAELEDNWWGGTNPGLKRLKIPNLMYCPEAIFGNKIAMLDVNFINPGSSKYATLEETLVDPGSGKTVEIVDNEAKNMESPAKALSKNISAWYKSFRNIAVVGLLIVLIYIGIRILIGSTAQDKAKYKERLQDWLVALVLVFVIHIIMAGVLFICEQVTNALSSKGNEFVVTVENTKKEEDEEEESEVTTPTEDAATTEDSEDSEDSYYNGDQSKFSFTTNLMGYVRFMTQINSVFDCGAYAIMYVALVIYTVMFTFTYLKRVLYMAFFTMIAPLVALTYPIDKITDGKAQAFNLWLKEFTMNAILQPVHLLLYTTLVTSAISLARQNPLYAIVALAFLTPAEKFIKKLFGLDKANSPATLGSMAAGGLALSGIGRVAGAFKGKTQSSNNKRVGGGSSSDESQLESRGRSVRYNTDPYDVIGGEGGVATFGGARRENGQQEQGPEQLGEPREHSPEEMDAFQRYNNEGFEQNAFGDYFDPWTDDFNPEFNPYRYGLDNNNGTNQQLNSRTAQHQVAGAINQQELRHQGNGQIQANNPMRLVNQENVVPEQNETIDNRVNRRLREERENARREGTRENQDLNRYLMNNGGDNERNRNAFWDGRATQIRKEERRADARRIRERRGEERKYKEAQTKFGKGLAVAKDLTGMKIKNKVKAIPEATMKVAKSTAKGAVKTAAKVGGAAVGAAVGGALAAGAAVASGENAGKILASGITTGAGLGASAGNGSANFVMDKASKEYGDYKEAIQAVTTDKNEVKEKRQTKFDKNFKNNAENYKYLLSKGMKPKQAKDFLQNRSQQFLDAGIDDIKLMHSAIRYQEKMKKDKGINIDDKTLVATTQIAKKLPSNFQENKGLKKSYAEDMMRHKPQINEKMAYGALDAAEAIRFPSD